MHPTEHPVERLTRALVRLRTRARILLLARWIGVILGAAIGAALCVALLDFALRLPSGVRVVVWLMGMAGLIFALWRLVIPAARFNPKLTDVALRVESARPEVRGLLASALDFAEHGDATAGDQQSDISRGLEKHVVEAAERQWTDALAEHLLRPGSALRALAFLALAALIALSPLAFSPGLWGIGAQRVLAPWTGASWPKRTGVADATGVEVYPLGRSLILRAALTRSNRPADSTDVFVRYRLVSDSKTGPSRRELLTLQPQTIEIAGTDGASPLFERRVEPIAGAIEYRFETEDDQTDWMRIKLVEPPAVVSAQAVIQPPDYVAGTESPEINAELGPGTDERAIAPNTLVGSRVAITMRLNKPARLLSPGGQAAQSLAALVDPEAATVEDAKVDGDRLTATLVLHSTLRLPIALVDEYDIRSVDEAVFIFGAAADNPAAATITDPAADTTVLATASVKIRAEGRDDVGLDWVSVERQILEPAGRPGSEPSGPGGATEPAGDPVEITRAAPGGEALVATIDTTLDLAPLDLHPGEEVQLTALATDLYAVEGVRRDPTRSASRILRIVSTQQFMEEIQAQLADVRQSAIRIEAQQSELQTSTRQSGADAANRRGQSQVSERVARQVDAIDRLEQRVGENRLDDQGLKELLDETRDTLNRAGQSASQAAKGMDQAAADAKQGEPAPQAGEQVEKDQQKVVDELAQLIRMLDAGQDNWVVRKGIQDVLEEQKQLQQQAGQMAAQTAGRNAEDLSPGERQRLGDIAKKQDELAQKLDDLLEEMRQREQALRQNDPMAAMGMAAASQRAQRDKPSQSMRQASESAQENQMSNASREQQEAIDSLEEMLEDLDAGDRQKDEVLRRMLLSIIQSIDALILEQRGEIGALDQAADAGADLAPLDKGMIALNANTLGVVDQAREGGADLAQVADLLQRAATLQGNAVKSLRAAAIDGKQVREFESLSLSTLEEAKRVAEAVEKKLGQQEMERRKRELRQAYREALEQEVALRADTEPFTLLEELSRRDRVRVRQKADTQEQIRARLAEIAKTTEEFNEARVYAHAHARLDKFASDAVAALGDGDPKAALLREDAVIATLKSIILSLKEPEPDPSDFAESSSGGGSGQQSGSGGEQLVTMIGELTLLRAIQGIVAEETSSYDQGILEPDHDNLTNLAGEQRDLAKVAEDLVSRLRGGAGTLPPPTPDQPAEDEGADKPSDQPADAPADDLGGDADETSPADEPSEPAK